MAKGLGRGLSALISEKKISISEKSNVTNINAGSDDVGKRDTLPVSSIIQGKFQPRTFFKEAELQELSDSIRKNGVVQPIIVRAIKDREGAYEIIAGERRWRAAKMAGLKVIPAIVMELNDRQAMEVALVENIQRQNLTPLEEAEGFRRLVDEFDYTHEQLSEVIGKSRSTITNSMRLLTLPDPVKNLINEEKISAGHAKILVAAKDPVLIANIIVKKGLNVRQTEKMLQRLSEKPAYKNRKDNKDPEIVQLEKETSKKAGLEITISNKDEKGSVTVSYFSLAELDDILRRLERK